MLVTVKFFQKKKEEKSTLVQIAGIACFLPQDRTYIGTNSH